MTLSEARHRLFLIITAAAVAMIGLLAPPASAAPATTAAAGPAETTATDEGAAAFLANYLAANNDHISVQWGSTPEESSADYGLTIDAILALDAAGIAQDQAAASTQWLADNIAGYISFGDPEELYAGATAKAAFLASVQGADPYSFGGTDLIAGLLSLQADNGRFSDRSQWGDYSNTFGQSWALLALDRAGVAIDPVAIDYLLAQQCADGGFRLTMGDPGGDCASEPDATAMAIQALIAVRGVTDADVQEALDYLASVQQADGSFGGGAPQTAPNSNSTAMAAVAFIAGERASNAGTATAYVAGLQFGCDSAASIAGAVAYDPAAYDERLAAGDAAVTNDQDRRATVQATLALAGVSLLTVTTEGATTGTPAYICAVHPTDPEPSDPGTSDPGTSDPGTSDPATSDPATSPAAPVATTTSAAAAPAAPTTAGTPGIAKKPSTTTPTIAATGADASIWLPAGLLLLGAGIGLTVLARRRNS